MTAPDPSVLDALRQVGEHAVALAPTVAIWVVYAAIVFGVVIVLPAWAITKVMPPRRNNTTRRPSKH